MALTIAGVITLLATGLGTIPNSQANGTTQAPNSAIAALEQKRAALIAELAAMQPNLRAAGGSLGSAEALFNAQQTKVLNERKQLDHLNATLLSLSSQLTSNDATVAQDKTQLAAITRATYENSGGDQVLAAVLAAPSFNQAMDELKSANQVTQQVLALVERLANANRAITAEQTNIRRDVAQAGALEGALAAQSNQLLVVLENRNTVFSGLSGPARHIAAEIANIDNQIAYIEAGPHVGNAPCGDHFAYGFCTYYVATRRCVPWLGNARDWYVAAAAMGYREGSMPVAGAIVVFRPGIDGTSSLGHVAYVEAVGPAAGIPAGAFKLSEMNFAGWNRVDYRVLSDTDGSIEGFIYGH
ncbi:MAG: CHAP domain-containing protein [Candidatus Dormiibacterota bacterium]